MWNWIQSRWRRVVGAIFVVQGLLAAASTSLGWLWQNIKWLLDWGGRIDFIQSHFGSIEFIGRFFFSPPGWIPIAATIIGLGMIWWDIKRGSASNPAAMARLAALGWTIKPEYTNGIMFEISHRPLPPMEESASCFRQLTEPFVLHFQSIHSLNGLHYLADIKGCEELSISAGEFTDISELADFKYLRFLALSQVPLNERGKVDATVLSSLVNLEKLTLSGSRVQSLVFLSSLKKLKTLWLKDTLAFDLSPLAQSASLEMVNVQGTRVVDLSPLNNHANLKELDIGAIQVHALASLQRPERLRRLNITGQENVDLTALSRLIDLERLSIWGQFRPDVGPLRSLTKLRHLSLQSFDFGVRSSPALNVQSLGDLANLKTLVLSMLPIRDISFLMRLGSLAEVNLSGLLISSLEPLRGLPSIRKLSLIDIQVVDISPLLTLPNLAELFVLRCPVRADVLAELERAGVKVRSL